MVWLYDKDGQWVFRVRRKVGNELQVSRIPMNHSTPLRYEFMTKLQNMLPEALEIGEQCVIRQLVILLNDSEDHLRRDFDQVFGPFLIHRTLRLFAMSESEYQRVGMLVD